MKKPISLSVHKNQVERRRRKDLRREMQDHCYKMTSSGNIVAYSIVALADDGRAFAVWDTGGAIPMWSFPQTVAAVLKEDIQESEVEDDFKRPLIDRAWKGSK